MIIFCTSSNGYEPTFNNLCFFSFLIDVQVNIDTFVLILLSNLLSIMPASVFLTSSFTILFSCYCLKISLLMIKNLGWICKYVLIH